jgi:hypothetical protein
MGYMNKFIPKKQNKKNENAQDFKARAEGWAAILTALRPVIITLLLLAFTVMAPKFGVDITSLQPDLIAPIVAALIQQ